MRTLGLDGSDFDGPSPEEVKRAFKQEALRWHPDSPNGDAARFQEVRDAYELLLERRLARRSMPTRSGMPSTPGARVWQEGVRVDEGRSAGGDGQWGLGGVLPAVAAIWLLLLGGFAASGPRREPPEGARGPGVVQVVQQRTQPLRGMEYVLMSSVGGKRGGELLLLDQPAAIAEAPQQPSARGGPSRRPAQIASALLAALDEETVAAADSSREAKYRSITAVVSDSCFSGILKALREEVDDEKLLENRYPYLLFSGRTVARFEREAPQQELLIISALDFRRPSTEPVDLVFQKIMARDHPPDLLAFDLSEADWRDLGEEYSSASGVELWRGLRPRGPASTSPAAERAAA